MMLYGPDNRPIEIRGAGFVPVAKRPRPDPIEGGTADAIGFWLPPAPGDSDE